MQLHCSDTKLPNLMLKTRPKQLLGSLPLDIALPGKIKAGRGEQNFLQPHLQFLAVDLNPFNKELFTLPISWSDYAVCCDLEISKSCTNCSASQFKKMIILFLSNEMNFRHVEN